MKDTLIDLTGQTFGHWKVLKRADNRKKIVMWLCKCDCGTEKIVQGTSLKNGTSNSCGCHSSAEWAEIIGIKYTTLYNRLIKFKWTIEKALSKKVI